MLKLKKKVLNIGETDRYLENKSNTWKILAAVLVHFINSIILNTSF